MKYIVYGGNSASGVNMRAKPSKSGAIVTVIKQGTEVQVSEIGESWSKIQYKGKTGYIMTEYLKGTDAKDELDNVSDVVEVDRADLQKVYTLIGNMLKGVKLVST